MAESFEENANISEVARRNGVARGLLTVWRHKLAAAAGATGPDRASCQSRSLPKAILRHSSRTYTLHQSRQLSRVHQLSIVTTFFAPRLSASVTSAWTMPRLAPVIKTVLFATFMFALPRIFTWPSLLCQVARSPTSSANRRTARIAFVFPRGLRHVQFCRTPA